MERTDQPDPMENSLVSARKIFVPPGISEVHIQMEMPDGACVEVNLEATTPDGKMVSCHRLEVGGSLPHRHFPNLVFPPALLGRTSGRQHAQTRAWAGIRAIWFLWAALGVYAFTRFIALPSFPIYFFTDEAVQTVTAANLLRDHLFSPTHEFLPTYFENGSQFNLSASVYLQAAPYFLLGKSIWVTRGAAALMTLIAAVCVGWICQKAFKSPYPWLAVLFLSVTPAWFLHSRTAFETALATSFYAGFLYCYLMYRMKEPRYLFGAVAFGALAFYSYNPMRMVMLVNGLLLLVVNIKFHFRNWKVLLGGLALGLLLAIPFLRFLINHPNAGDWQMRLLGSYWILDISLWEKIKTFGLEYLRGLDPLYWYLPHTQDLPRHILLGYGHVFRLTIPFALVGIGLAVRRMRLPEYRILGVSLLAAPTGAALVQLGITRALVMVIPLAIFTALGASAVLEWLHRRFKLPRTLLSLVVFALLAGGNLYMLRDALVNGPVWFHDYGLTGMQYGAQQVFGAVAEYLQAHPKTRVVLSPSWSNGTDEVARFFFSDPLPFEMGSPDDFFNQVLPLDNTVLIMIPEEYARIPLSRFSKVKVEKTLPYPNGEPGFYFVRLKYVDNIETVIAREEALRHKPEEKQFMVDGEPVQVAYTRLDMGEIEDVLTGGKDGLVRTDSINPMLLSFAFSTPRPMNSLTLRVGGTATSIAVKVWLPGRDEPELFSRVLPETPDPRIVEIVFPGDRKAARVWVEIKNTNDPTDAHVHLWKLIFQ